MRGVNKVIILGNLGKDPEIQVLEGNVSIARFPLATSETFKDHNGKSISQTEWHNVVLWRGLAELAQKYLHKNSLVYIEGHLKSRAWEDKDGIRRYATEIIGKILVMLDHKTQEGEAAEGNPPDEKPEEPLTNLNAPKEPQPTSLPS